MTAEQDYCLSSGSFRNVLGEGNAKITDHFVESYRNNINHMLIGCKQECQQF